MSEVAYSQRKAPFPSLRVHSKHEGTNMKCKPNCAPCGTLKTQTGLASCSGAIHWRYSAAYSAGSHGGLLWWVLGGIHRLAGYSLLVSYAEILSGILGAIHWRAALVGYSAGSIGELLWRGTGILGGIHWAGSTGQLLLRDTRRDPLASSAGGILGGIHWRAALAGYSAGSTGELLWRDTG